MTSNCKPVQLYSLALRREVPITGADGQATGEVRHLTETHEGCTWEEGLAIRKRTQHVADAMCEKLRMGQPGKVTTTFDIGQPVNMQAPAGPRKPRPAAEARDSSKWGKPAQRAPRAREPVARREGTTLADLVNVMAGKEDAA